MVCTLFATSTKTEIMTATFIVNTIIFLFITIILNPGSWQGALLRGVCGVMVLMNAAMSLKALGFIVAAPEGMRWF